MDMLFNLLLYISSQAHAADIEVCIISEGGAIGEAEIACDRKFYTTSAVAHNNIEVLKISKSHLKEIVAKLPASDKRSFAADCRKRLGFRNHHVQYVLGKI